MVHVGGVTSQLAAPTGEGAPGRWDGGIYTAYHHAAELYQRYTTSNDRHIYKTCRIKRKSDARIVVASSGYVTALYDETHVIPSIPEGGPTMEALNVSVDTIKQKLAAARETEQAEFDAAQATLAAEQKQELDAVTAIFAAHPTVVARAFHRSILSIGNLMVDEALRKFEREYDHEIEVATPTYSNPGLDKLISVFDAVSDTSVKVYPGDELYRVL